MGSDSFLIKNGFSGAKALTNEHRFCDVQIVEQLMQTKALDYDMTRK